MKSRILLPLMAAMLALGFQPAIAAAQTAMELEVDLLEVHLGRGSDHLVLDSTLTLGDGADQLLIKAAGGSETRTAFDDLELQALYSRSLSDKVALHFGMRHDMRAGSDLTHGVAGLVAEVLPGLEAEHYLFVSQDGDLTGAGQLVLGVDLAPRLVLEPRLAVGWSAQEIPGENLGNGLTDVEASLRLRHALSDNFNVYAGVVHERLVGSTRSIALTAGDPARVTRAVVGLGFSF
ncbi:MAG: copper resistance protein B [Sphingorhabdus sp.]